jgi:hypothetical protein
MAPRGIHRVMTLLRKPLRLFACVQPKVTPTSFETDTIKLTMLHDVHDLVPSGGVEQQQSVTELGVLEPRWISKQDVNSIRWIQTRCAESFAAIDKGGMTVFMYGPFVKSISSLTLGITLFLFIPTLCRKELDEAWSGSALRRFERETIEDHLEKRIERKVIVCCADDPYRPSEKLDELRQDRVSESETPEVNAEEIIELYPKCPVLIDLPAIDWHSLF